MTKLGAKLYTDLKEFVKLCDVVTINLSLSDKTKGMFSKEIIDSMKDAAYLVNNARGAIVDAKAVRLQVFDTVTNSRLSICIHSIVQLFECQ